MYRIDSRPRHGPILALALLLTVASVVPALAADPAKPPVGEPAKGRTLDPLTGRALDPATGRPVEPTPRVPLNQPMLIFTIDIRVLGTSAYRVERDVSVPVERAVASLPGVRHVHSSAIGGRVQTQVSFDASVDASNTAKAIQTRLDQIKTHLPRTASRPLIAWHRETL